MDTQMVLMFLMGFGLVISGSVVAFMAGEFMSERWIGYRSILAKRSKITLTASGVARLKQLRTQYSPSHSFIKKAISTVRERKRTKRINEQMPDALDVVAQALQAGLSLPQSLRQAAHQTEDPLKFELSNICALLDCSTSIADAFSARLGKLESVEVKMVSLALDIQSRLGGNMRRMLQKSASYMRQTQDMQRSLQSQTAQARLSLRLVVAIPFALCVILSIVMPQYLMPLFVTSQGRLMLLIALVLDSIGIVWARSVMRIDL